MARIRDPARDKAKELYLNNKYITNREIANILKIDEKKVATWKYRDKWECNTEEKKNVVQQNKKCSTTKPKEERKALISNEDKDYEWVDEIDGLSDKQRLFCHYYMQSLNAFQAAIKAEYSPSYARVDVYRLLENPSIKKYLGKLKEQQKQDFLISQEKILNRHVQVAFSDINEYFEEDGSLKPITHTDGSLIKKLKITETDKGTTVEIELIEKCKSLDALTKYLGLENNKGNSGEGIPKDKTQGILKKIRGVRK